MPSTKESRRSVSDFFPHAQNFVISGGEFTSNVTHTHSKKAVVSSDFRTIPMGDLDLLQEIQSDRSRPTTREHERGTVTRLLIAPLSKRTYSARINGRKSDMTVAVYQGQNAEEEWRRDVSKYSNVRHPKFLQVYGVSGSSSLYATVFHDDLIPLQEIYSLCRRSILATAYLDAYFGLELSDAEGYIHSTSGTFLHHGAYTPWIRRSTGRLCVDLSPSVINRPLLPIALPAGVPHIPVPPLARDQDAAIIDGLTLRQQLEIINHWHGISVSSSPSLLLNVNGLMKLGALMYHRSDREDPIEIASVPSCAFEDSGWKLRIRGSSGASKPVRMKDGWTRFDYFNVTTTGMASREIYWPDAAECWLPQANYVLRGLEIDSDVEAYRVIYGIDYWLSFSNMADVSPKDGYLFLCPLSHLRSHDSTHFRNTDFAAYWSLDPSGVERLSHWMATMLGFPSLSFKMKIWSRSWNDSVYTALRQFHSGKGFDPETQDVARHMGVPLYTSPWINEDELDGEEQPIEDQEYPDHIHSTFDASTVLESIPETPELEKMETQQEISMEPNSANTFLSRQRRTSLTLGALLILLLIFLLRTSFFVHFRRVDSNIIGVAIQRAERLESSWLLDDALIHFIELLRYDERAAAVYNAIEGEGLRMKWVQRQLGV
ncbi:hypothetical protein B0H16DRAFT_331112 [Mycena metata]|uniref:Uncharacterized protein n=1 Tax=Mycena metata TaxID=1033252 RepID=A0AAD7HML3_9AGAR|nr:hypothetical protein B0H16DRAFT_331112 [Mycena metata]